MTTIAYRDGVLAADRRCLINGWKQPHQLSKLFEVGDGSICAVTGDYANAMRVVRHLQMVRSADEAPPLNENSRVIWLRSAGKMTIFEGDGHFDMECDFTAFGSGAPTAQAAMYAGTDAKRAVEIASLLDDQTGPDVETMSI